MLVAANISTNISGYISEYNYPEICLKPLPTMWKFGNRQFGTGHIQAYVSTHLFTDPVQPGLFYKHLCDSLTHPFPPNLQDTFTPKPYELRTRNFEKMFTSLHVSHVTCHISRVTCHILWVMCHKSHVRCHMSCVTCHVSHITCQMQQGEKTEVR